VSLKIVTADLSPADEQTIVSDYPYGVVHLATYAPKAVKEAHLVFCWVELVPRGFPQPQSAPPNAQSVRSPHEGRLFHSRIAMTGGDAIGWYKAAKGNALLTPKALEEDVKDLAGIPVFSQLDREDPLWPRLSLFTGVEQEQAIRHEMPFLPDWHRQPRVHRMLGTPDHRLLGIVTRPEHSDWLSTRLFVDFGLHPEWLGGLALVAPNPLWSEMHHRRIPGSGSVPDRSLIRFVPRPDANLSQVEVIAYERRRGAISAVSLGKPAKGSALLFDHEQRIEELGVAVFDPTRGLLHLQPPRSFLESIGVRTSLVESERVMTAPIGASTAAPTERFIVPDFSDHEWTVGQASGGPYPAVIAAARRGRRVAAEALGQRWFGNNRQAAAGFVRSLIMQARRKVQIYDPYVTGLELFRFLQAVTRKTVSVRAVTSSLPFKQSTAAERLRLLSELEQEQQRLRSHLGDPSAVEIAVLPGDPPPLHDRFLVVDDEIWFTGNSLGTLGDRAGMMIRLPDPAPVAAELDLLFSGAEPAGEFVERRRREDQASGTSS
jgi:hypothetical protein